METLGAKIFFTNSMEDFTDKELENMKQVIQEELTKRREDNRKIVWDKMISAIKHYVYEFGCFEFEEEDGVSCCITTDFTADFNKEIIHL